MDRCVLQRIPATLFDNAKLLRSSRKHESRLHSIKDYYQWSSLERVKFPPNTFVHEPSSPSSSGYHAADQFSGRR